MAKMWCLSERIYPESLIALSDKKLTVCGKKMSDVILRKDTVVQLRGLSEGQRMALSEVTRRLVGNFYEGEVCPVCLATLRLKGNKEQWGI